MSVLRVAKRDGLATLTLNRPDKLNALSRELRRAIRDTFLEIEDDPEVRVAIVTGEGRAFCAGLDLVELGAQQASEPGQGTETGDSLVDAVRDFSGPIIGAINGHAITGGFELALACDVLIASTQARFADTHARVGVAPGWGLSQRLPRLIGISRAKELSFTGNFIDAAQAERWGLVNRVVEPDELLPVCTQLARDMLSCDEETLRTYKQQIDRGYDATFEEGMRIEGELSRRHAKARPSGAVEARRRDVQARGRTQQGTGGG